MSEKTLSPPAPPEGWPAILANLPVLHHTQGTSQHTHWGQEISGSRLSPLPLVVLPPVPGGELELGLLGAAVSPCAARLPRPLRDTDAVLAMPQDTWEVWKCSSSSWTSPPVSTVAPGVWATAGSFQHHNRGPCDAPAMTHQGAKACATGWLPGPRESW